MSSRKSWKSLKHSVQLNMILKTDLDEMRSFVGSVYQADPFAVDMEEVDDEQSPQPTGCELLPGSRFRTAWDIVQAPMLLYVMISVPFRFGFNIVAPAGSAMFWFEVLVDVYFTADCVRAATSTLFPSS